MNTRAYRMQSRADSAERTSEAILTAAAQIFWAQPTPDLSLDDVAERAGVSTRTVLRKYGSKEGLLSAAAQREVQSVADQRGRVVPGDVTSAVDNLIEHYETYGDKVLRLIAASATSPALAELVEQGKIVHRQWCREAFGPYLATTALSDRPRRLAQLVAICDVQTWNVLRHDMGLPPAQTRTALIELIQPLTKES